METYEQKQITEVLNDKSEFGYEIKITSENKGTNWLYLDEEKLNAIKDLFKSK